MIAFAVLSRERRRQDRVFSRCHQISGLKTETPEQWTVWPFCSGVRDALQILQTLRSVSAAHPLRVSMPVVSGIVSARDTSGKDFSSPRAGGSIVM
jgi:hypothetical protein